MGAKKTSKASSSTTNLQQDNRIVAGEGSFVQGSEASYYSDDDLALTDSRSWWQDQSIRYADSSTRLTDASVTDNSNRSSNFLDFSDRSLSYSDSRATFTDSRDQSNRSSNWLDLSDRSDRSSAAYLLDSSNRSVTNITGTDPGAVKVAEFGAELVRDLNERNTDSVRLIAGLGSDALARMGASATDLYSRAGQNTAASWKDTVTAGERLFSDAAARAERVQTDTFGLAGDLIGGILDRAGRTADGAGRLAEAALLNAQPTEGKIADGAKWAMLAVAGAVALVVVPRILKA